MRRYKSKAELRDADLSALGFEEMTAEEKEEMERRFREFVTAMQGGAPRGGPEEPEKPKVRKWDPSRPKGY